MSFQILIAHESKVIREACAEAARGLGVEARTAENWSSAQAALDAGTVEIVLLGAGLSGGANSEMIAAVRRANPEADVILIGAARGRPEAARAAAKGAVEFTSAPVRRDELRSRLERLLQKRRLSFENRLLRAQLQARQGLGALVGTSMRMQQIYERVLKVAPRRHPVLVLGESGTGKELVARAIHTFGPWRERPFVPVDCGALSATLIESELFGHVRGAFTGANHNRAGLLATAGAGTIFLDEIAELPVELQAKLLRALQEHEIRPLGSNQRVPFEARVIAGTSQHLEAAIARGTFRKDLYFRLNVVTLRLPPLRERKSDIASLVYHFLDRYASREGGPRGISPEALARLMSYDWPGNVRELENAIQRAVALGADAEVQVKDLPSNVLSGALDQASGPPITPLRELERRAILEALEATAGDRLRAAQLLGIGKTTIYRKLRAYGIEAGSASLARA